MLQRAVQTKNFDVEAIINKISNLHFMVIFVELSNYCQNNVSGS